MISWGVADLRSDLFRVQFLDSSVGLLGLLIHRIDTNRQRTSFMIPLKTPGSVELLSSSPSLVDRESTPCLFFPLQSWNSSPMLCDILYTLILYGPLV